MTAITPFHLDSWTYGNGYRQLHLVASIHISAITEKYRALILQMSDQESVPYFLCYVIFYFTKFCIIFGDKLLFAV